MRSHLQKFDHWFIYKIRRLSLPAARLALFVVFFWFGILKLIGTSPANPLVAGLLTQTLPFVPWDVFIILFALYEVAIGLAFLFPGMERVAIALIIPHMIMTSLPLAFLPEMTWQGFLTPTLEGQYIIKNLVIIALAMGVAARLTPMGERLRSKK